MRFRPQYKTRHDARHITLNMFPVPDNYDIVYETLEAMKLLAETPILWQVIYPTNLPWSEESRIAVLNTTLPETESEYIERESAEIERAQAEILFQQQIDDISRRHRLECEEAMLTEAEFDVASPPVIATGIRWIKAPP